MGISNYFKLMLYAVRGAIAVFVAKATKSFTRLRTKVSQNFWRVDFALFRTLRSSWSLPVLTGEHLG